MVRVGRDLKDHLVPTPNITLKLSTSYQLSTSKWDQERQEVSQLW